MNILFNDLRYGVRGLLKKPAFTAIAVLTLALGIGANTAIFSVVNAVLLRPLAVKDPDRVMTFWHSAPAKGLKHVDLNDALVAYYRDRTRTFQGLAAFETGNFSITGGGEPEVVPAAIVTFNYFEVLGREPLYGRTFTAPEDTPGNNNVVLLSYGLWQRRFGGNREVIGQPINLNGEAYTVAGVLPAHFTIPNAEIEIAAPLRLASDPRRRERGSNFLRVFGRLEDGVTLAQARAQHGFDN